jgi:hypothetical protein
MTITPEHLRRYAVARSLFFPTTLGRAVAKLGFVQADPIRALRWKRIFSSTTDQVCRQAIV